MERTVLAAVTERSDADTALAEQLRRVCASMDSLRRLCAQAHEKLRDSGVGKLLDQVFTTLPEPVLTPADCYQAMIRSRTERVPLADLPGRIAATTVVVTPPGIPMLMPGEATGPADGALMTYLRALEDFDRAFPDLATDIHGAHRDGTGRYWIEVVSA
ncbi:hypothetical protein AB0O34_26190 [Sphaerisporangium sp. NPDC088356]|uniref:Orn/Lys/Arg family decarboxylase n=1 Tax=Sphaerisporangium sp. NPDC088356 TaxID=3154871 RepID=UPI0034209536